MSVQQDAESRVLVGHASSCSCTEKRAWLSIPNSVFSLWLRQMIGVQISANIPQTLQHAAPTCFPGTIVSAAVPHPAELQNCRRQLPPLLACRVPKPIKSCDLSAWRARDVCCHTRRAKETAELLIFARATGHRTPRHWGVPVHRPRVQHQVHHTRVVGRGGPTVPAQAISQLKSSSAVQTRDVPRMSCTCLSRRSGTQELLIGLQ